MDMYIFISSYNWEKYFELCADYYNKNHNLLIPATYEIEDLKLGGWIRRQRQSYQQKNGLRLTQTQIDRLENVGMVWNVSDYRWNSNFSIVKNYLENHSELPYNYIENNIKIGIWWNTQIKKYILSELSEYRMNKVRGLFECLEN